MKFEQLTAVILLSCYLFLNPVRSAENCTGWFGPDCQFKCRCTNDSCDFKGRCTSLQPCTGGWFGPECQYADLAYNLTKKDMAAVTDGNDKTCVASTTVTNISIPLDVMLSWIRVHFKVYGVLDKLDIETNGNDISTICNNKRKVTVDDWTLDIYCANSPRIKQLVLSGEGTKSLCSVYVSGGRNLALKQKTSQSTTFNPYVSSRAVDGNRNPNMAAGSCSMTGDVTAAESLGTWEITLSSPRLVNRYQLYNKNANLYRLFGFTLESSDETGRIVFKYKDENPAYQAVYNIFHTDRLVKRVVVTSGTTSNMLQLCEFEMYGDLICPRGYYGFYCDMTCKCENQEACLASTGSCPLGCPAGSHGVHCQLSCEEGTFGSDCHKNCSKFCRRQDSNKICDRKIGDCFFQCEVGYLPPRCDSECPRGKFGNTCNFACSTLCYDNGLPNKICHHVTGDCLFCKDGYLPPTCEKECPPGKYGNACKHTCSMFCVNNKLQNTTCHHVTGACLLGCQGGYLPPTCEKVCPPGTFGDDCNFKCSKFCVNITLPNTTCHHVTGACPLGCQGGYLPPTCEKVEKTAIETGMYSMDMIIGMCVLLALLLLLGYCLYPRMKAKPKGEMVEEGAHLSASHAVVQTTASSTV